MVDRRTTADEGLKWGKNPGANDRGRVQCQQGRRVTTATPELTQERSDERALAEAKVRDQCAIARRWAHALLRVFRCNAGKSRSISGGKRMGQNSAAPCGAGRKPGGVSAGSGVVSVHPVRAGVGPVTRPQSVVHRRITESVERSQGAWRNFCVNKRTSAYALGGKSLCGNGLCYCGLL